MRMYQQGTAIPISGIIVMSIILLVVVFAVGMSGRRYTVKLLKSQAFWGSLIGAVVGFTGIPMVIPFSSEWVWEYPTGFYTASILVFATLGFLVGLSIQQSSKKPLQRLPRQAVIGLSLVSSLTLLLGLIGFYRFQALNQSNMWAQARIGLLRADSVKQDLASGKTTPKDLRSYGTQLLIAGADLGSARAFSLGYGNAAAKIYPLASALNTAGYNLVNSQNPLQVQTSERFIDQVGALVHSAVKRNNGNLYPKAMLQIISKANQFIPRGYRNAAPN